MDKVTLSSKVFTENPLLDEIVFNIKQLATGTVLKDEDKANNAETLESMQNGDLLIAINHGTAIFENFYYDEEIISLFVLDPALARKYALDNSLIPTELRLKLLAKASELFLENYVEYNNYYRMLHGEPDYDESDMWKGLYIDKDEISESIPTSTDYIYAYETDIPGYDSETGTYDTDKYGLIHELSLTLINILDNNGTLSNIIEDTTWQAAVGLETDQVRYLNFLSEKSIEYYNARVAEKFAMIYCPSCDSEEVRNRYKDLFEANRLYMLYTMYSDAYKFKSDYYDNFIMIFLVLQTFVDMIVELPEYLIRRDVFDTRTCKYIFESNGVKYFKDIPLRYQVALVKNLNKLIKFKSTDKCIIDIISIFGFKNINAFRYYILKDRNVENPDDLTYYDNHKEVEGVEVEDNDKNYDLKFIRVPLQEGYDDYARFDSNVFDYDELVDPDSYWNGDKSYEDVKSEIKDLDFTILRSKYYSVEAVVDLTKKNFSLVYFLNMLLYNNIDKTALKISLPNVSTTKKFNLVDAIIALYSLGYIYYGSEDIILDSRAKIFQILGFNLQADMEAVATYLSENFGGLTLKDLHADNFTVPDNKTIVSYDQLQNIFINNKEVYDHVRMVMANPPSKEVYNAYRYLRKTLLTMNCNMEYFIISGNSIINEYKDDGYDVKFVNIPKESDYSKSSVYEKDYEWFLSTLNTTTLYLSMSDDFESDHSFNLYTFDGNDIIQINGTAKMAYTLREYLSYSSGTLYKFVDKIASITNEESRQEAAINAIQMIVDYLNDYIDEEHIGAYLDDIFSGLPSISVDFVKKYIEEVVDFFKSFKIFTHQSSLLYVIDDKYDECVQLIDHVLLKYLFDKSEYVKIEDFIYGNNVDISPKLRYDLIDKAWLTLSTWAKKEISEYYENNRNNADTTKIRYKKYYCPNCGSQIDAGSATCSNCGAAIVEPTIISNYNEYQDVISDYLTDTGVHDVYDTMMAHWHPDMCNIKYEIPGDTPEEKEANRKEIYATDALIRLAIDLTLRDSRNIDLKPVEKDSSYVCPFCGEPVKSTDDICSSCGKFINGTHIASDKISGINETKDLDDMYNEYMTDLKTLVSTFVKEDGVIHCVTYYCPYCDTQLENAAVTTCPNCGKLIPEPISRTHYKTNIQDSAPYYTKIIPASVSKMNDNVNKSESSFIEKDKCIGMDSYYGIVTQEFPAHEFQ